MGFFRVSFLIENLFRIHLNVCVAKQFKAHHCLSRISVSRGRSSAFLCFRAESVVSAYEYGAISSGVL